MKNGGGAFIRELTPKKSPCSIQSALLNNTHHHLLKGYLCRDLIHSISSIATIRMSVLGYQIWLDLIGNLLAVSDFIRLVECRTIVLGERPPVLDTSWQIRIR